ncbi:ParB/RepB/Spo0J family partition protein [Brachyspira hyodysenteriae]|uniref:ParB/RepB/Spo0J family partition protein n=1 Tax=Brachyspira hyodysenteriae TaxID=159 RepID=UPI0022CD39E9|nr:ParB/RepB/Spo0J family partition protein [Brachyspira hyodysenteriae]MCZ9891552.1 ParB/RepB/Spo0J family partition protein [Brachyspira hyodysenteriae]MCZ9989100.1 ParB/RepB/Spo0J family partition protein [Brachyspira hyodysenteriae]MCZ9997462.1 ParB/RepB/Spo0J family partition protein [Brachyspira hyodysenteriae]MDA0000904.1 ParB/RepB/Spo0J family partition protein [Brachyspira hyodysenteriae]MDA0005911.1 ParB/RepB/Spo0J family partition protein [Brachyspira hyodysenteriae]
MSRKGGLGGQGLSALIKSADNEIRTAAEEAEKNGVLEIDVSLIDVNPDQPRKVFNEEEIQGLAESIKENGLINPITLREKDGKYQIISGERRFRAFKFLNRNKVPALVLQNIADSKMLELTLVENIQRADLNAIEVARSYKKLIYDLNIKQEELALRVGKSRSTISNSMRILDLSENIQNLILESKITEGHARAILSLSDENEREEFAKEIIEKGYSVRECERIVKERKNNISNDLSSNNEENTENQNEVKKENKKDPNIKKLENDLEKIFSTKVNVIDKNGKEGKIVIEYYSSDDLSRIMDMLEKIYERETGIKPTLEY